MPESHGGPTLLKLLLLPVCTSGLLVRCWNKGTAAGNRPVFPLFPPSLCPWCVVFGGGGGQENRPDQRDADTFPMGQQNCIYQQDGWPAFTPRVSKCDSTSCITVKSACTVFSYSRRATAIGFVDELKFHGMHAKLIG